MSKEAYKQNNQMKQKPKRWKDESKWNWNAKKKKQTKNKKQTHNKSKQTETNFLEQDGGNRLLDNCLLKKHDDLHSY